jgi:hypothetical protein
MLMLLLDVFGRAREWTLEAKKATRGYKSWHLRAVRVVQDIVIGSSSTTDSQPKLPASVHGSNT